MSARECDYLSVVPDPPAVLDDYREAPMRLSLHVAMLGIELDALRSKAWAAGSDGNVDCAADLATACAYVGAAIRLVEKWAK